jgi:hypothetical protein
MRPWIQGEKKRGIHSQLKYISYFSRYNPIYHQSHTHKEREKQREGETVRCREREMEMERPREKLVRGTGSLSAAQCL